MKISSFLANTIKHGGFSWFSTWDQDPLFLRKNTAALWNVIEAESGWKSYIYIYFIECSPVPLKSKNNRSIFVKSPKIPLNFKLNLHLPIKLSKTLTADFRKYCKNSTGCWLTSQRVLHRYSRDPWQGCDRFRLPSEVEDVGSQSRSLLVAWLNSKVDPY